MNKISFFILLVVIFLGLSKSFAPSEVNTDYVASEKALPKFFTSHPLSLILVEQFETGFLIKTYYHRYRVVGPDALKNQIYDTILFRTSKSFWEKNRDNLGMSLFSRDMDDKITMCARPPGDVFIGNPSYGGWEVVGNKKIWRFYRGYAINAQEVFSWGDFVPSYEFYQRMKIFSKEEKVFYGKNNEFGSNGKVTKEYLIQKKLKQSFEQDNSPKSMIAFKTHVKRFLRIPQLVTYSKKTPRSHEQLEIGD